MRLDTVKTSSATFCAILPALAAMKAKEKQPLIEGHWMRTMLNRAMEGDFEGAFHCVEAACIGEEIFLGINRIPRACLDGEPVGEHVSLSCTRDMLHVLYRSMQIAGALGKELDLRDDEKPWGPLFNRASPLIEWMEAEEDMDFKLAALYAQAISEWVRDHRRLEASTH